jgi:hypothetical protein
MSVIAAISIRPITKAVLPSRRRRFDCGLSLGEAIFKQRNKVAVVSTLFRFTTNL